MSTDCEINLQVSFADRFRRRALYEEVAQFLPHATRINGSGEPIKPAAGTASVPLPNAPGASDRSISPEEDLPATWRALIPELRALQATEWPGLRDSLAIGGTQAFARKLYTLGQSRGCRPLINYAGKLGADAESYSIRELKARLLEFPALIQSIEGKS